MSRGALSGEAGFTLLEIMLVIVIMAVTAMMLAPSYFSAISASPDAEARRLAQVLRLATEESALSGAQFRVRLQRHAYRFQNPDATGEWRTLQQAPYAPYRLPEGVQIVETRPAAPLTDAQSGEAEHAGGAFDAEPVLADLLLEPVGVRRIADILLAAEPDDGERIVVQLRPGPGGIAVKDAQ